MAGKELTNFHACSRFFRHDLAVAPDVDGGAVSSGGFAGHAGRAAKGAANRGGKGRGTFCFRFDGPCSIRRGLSPELSCTAHASASRQ